MYYKKEETYSFSVPKEYNAYLKFKKELKDTGVTFTEGGGAFTQTITIRTTGRFDVEELHYGQN